MSAPDEASEPIDRLPLKRPSNFVLEFSLPKDGAGSASIQATFQKEHIPFLIKALSVAEEILALDEAPSKQSPEGDPRA